MRDENEVGCTDNNFTFSFQKSRIKWCLQDHYAYLINHVKKYTAQQQIRYEYQMLTQSTDPIFENTCQLGLLVGCTSLRSCRSYSKTDHSFNPFHEWRKIRTCSTVPYLPISPSGTKVNFDQNCTSLVCWFPRKKLRTVVSTGYHLDMIILVYWFS